MQTRLHRPAGPIAFSLLGVLPAFRSDPLGFLQKTATDFGDVASFRLGLKRAFFVNRPDLIEEVLVHGARYFTKSRVLQRARSLLGDGLLTSEGDFHTRQRKAIQPAFYRERLSGYAATIVDYGEQLNVRWRDGETVDIAQEMMRVTLAIVGRTLLGYDIEGDARDIGTALTGVISSFDSLISPFAPLMERVPISPSVRRNRAAARFLNEAIYRIISERRASGTDTGDLLSTLIAASEDGHTMTDKQVRDEALTLMLAGHETTAISLTWTWYLLSQNPWALERLRAEWRDVLGDRSPAWADIPNLVYTEHVFAESLRLYPPAWAIGRMARSEFRLFNYLVPKQSICIMSPYVMHRHPRFWPEPERFDPDRWTPEARESRPKFAYFPFGGGPRTCAGERFAWMEGILLLATIGRKWTIHHIAEHPVKPHPQITLRPRNGMPARLERVLA
jgi:cytochrome P450